MNQVVKFTFREDFCGSVFVGLYDKLMYRPVGYRVSSNVFLIGGSFHWNK